VLVVFCMLRKKEEKKKREISRREISIEPSCSCNPGHLLWITARRSVRLLVSREYAFIVRALIGIRCRITTVWRHSVDKCRFSRAKKRPFLLLFPQDICPFDAVLVNDLAFEPRVDRGTLSKAAVTRAMSARQLTSRRATFGELTILAPLARRICAMVRKINALSPNFINRHCRVSLRRRFERRRSPASSSEKLASRRVTKTWRVRSTASARLSNYFQAPLSASVRH